MNERNEMNGIVSDQISEDLVENITQHLTKSITVNYYKVKITPSIWGYCFGNQINDTIEIYDEYKDIKKQRIPICQCRGSRHNFFGCRHQFQYGKKFAVPFTSKKIIGAKNILSLRAVCKGFNRVPIVKLINQLNCQFQRGKYTFILLENLRFDYLIWIFPERSDHPLYENWKRNKEWITTFQVNYPRITFFESEIITLEKDLPKNIKINQKYKYNDNKRKNNKRNNQKITKLNNINYKQKGANVYGHKHR
jgi:hypothetical protein